MTERPAWLFLLLLISSISHGWADYAQGYPTRPIRYVVPSSAGGGADVLGRILAKGLSEAFNQQVIVDNRAGASGNIAAELVARAPADGYTILQVNIVHAANVTLFDNLSYDLVRDFAPVTQTDSSSSIVVVDPSLPAKSIDDLIRLAKARPGSINFAAAGTGSASHLATMAFAERARIDMVHVP